MLKPPREVGGPRPVLARGRRPVYYANTHPLKPRREPVSERILVQNLIFRAGHANCLVRILSDRAQDVTYGPIPTESVVTGDQS